MHRTWPLLVTSLVLAGASSTAWAQDASIESAAFAPEPSADSGGDTEFVYDGRGVWVAGGAGALPELEEPMGYGRLQLVWPFGELFAGEVTSSAFQFTTIDHHLEEVRATGLGIGVGLRVTAPPDWTVRPYAAARFSHVHLSPDPFGEHDYAEGSTVDAHESHHRWGGALGGGLDIGLGGPTSRWRAGLDGEVGALSGPGFNVLTVLVANLGIAF
jgi:hypothetical protein